MPLEHRELALDPSLLDATLAFTDTYTAQLMAPSSTGPSGPISGNALVADVNAPLEDHDFLDAFLRTFGAEPAEPLSTQSLSSPPPELSLEDSDDLFGDSLIL